MPAYSSEQQIEITSCAKLVFSQFWRCFCETQNSKEHHCWNYNLFEVSNEMKVPVGGGSTFLNSQAIKS